MLIKNTTALHYLRTLPWSPDNISSATIVGVEGEPSFACQFVSFVKMAIHLY